MKDNVRRLDEARERVRREKERRLDSTDSFPVTQHPPGEDEALRPATGEVTARHTQPGEVEGEQAMNAGGNGGVKGS